MLPEFPLDTSVATGRYRPCYDNGKEGKEKLQDQSAFIKRLKMQHTLSYVIRNYLYL